MNADALFRTRNRSRCESSDEIGRCWGPTMALSFSTGQNRRQDLAFDVFFLTAVSMMRIAICQRFKCGGHDPPQRRLAVVLAGLRAEPTLARHVAVDGWISRP